MVVPAGHQRAAVAAVLVAGGCLRLAGLLDGQPVAEAGRDVTDPAHGGKHTADGGLFATHCPRRF